MQSIHVTVAAIVEHNGKFLMVEEIDNNGKRVFNQPAGHVEHQESIIDAVIREVKEETNIHFVPEHLIGTYLLSPATNGKHYLRFCFTGKTDQTSTVKPNDSDILACHWYTIDQIKNLQRQLRSGLVLSCLADYLKGKRYPIEALHFFDDEVAAAQSCYDQL